MNALVLSAQIDWFLDDMNLALHCFLTFYDKLSKCLEILNSWFYTSQLSDAYQLALALCSFHFNWTLCMYTKDNSWLTSSAIKVILCTFMWVIIIKSMNDAEVDNFKVYFLFIFLRHYSDLFGSFIQQTACILNEQYDKIQHIKLVSWAQFQCVCWRWGARASHTLKQFSWRGKVKTYNNFMLVLLL